MVKLKEGRVWIGEDGSGPRQIKILKLQGQNVYNECNFKEVKEQISRSRLQVTLWADSYRLVDGMELAARRLNES